MIVKVYQIKKKEEIYTQYLSASTSYLRAIIHCLANTFVRASHDITYLFNYFKYILRVASASSRYLFTNPLRIHYIRIEWWVPKCHGSEKICRGQQRGEVVLLSIVYRHTSLWLLFYLRVWHFWPLHIFMTTLGLYEITDRARVPFRALHFRYLLCLF